MLNHFAWAQNAMEEENMVEEDNLAFRLIDSVVKGNTDFALDLYAQLTEYNKGNLFFSPYSISTALAMTYAGARENTATQMSSVLHFPQQQAELHTAFYHLQSDVTQAQKDVDLRIANALWGQEQHPFSLTFKNDVQNYYNAKLEEVDFTTAVETIRKKINDWVEQHTNNKIKELVKSGIITQLTRLVLVNAIYFKGKWANPFKENDTQEEPFWVKDDESIEVPMMTQKHYFRYMENETFQGLELPYVGTSSSLNPREKNNISMIVLLPQQRDGLANVEESLKENLDDYLQHSYRQKVKVFLPKFKINTGFELSDTLSTMGMPDAFSEKADFSGIDGQKQLYLTSVIHQAFVDVNEEGTEAAAATAVFATTRGMPPPTPTFRADHPFIFLIRHNSSGSILFLGRVVNPTK
jgi:serpin B